MNMNFYYPTNKVVGHRDMAVIFKQPVKQELEHDDEEENKKKELSLTQKNQKILTTVNVDTIQKNEKVQLNTSLKGNDCLRRRWNPGTHNIHH